MQGEGIERLAQLERSGDVRACAALPELRDRVMPSLVPLIERQLADTPAGTPHRSGSTGTCSSLAGEARGSPVLLPADWGLRRSPTGSPPAADECSARLWPPAPIGTGRRPRALLELVERDAAGLWWIGGRRGPPVALDDPSLPALVRLLGTLRRARRGAPGSSTSAPTSVFPSSPRCRAPTMDAGLPAGWHHARA